MWAHQFCKVPPHSKYHSERKRAPGHAQAEKDKPHTKGRCYPLEYLEKSTTFFQMSIEIHHFFQMSTPNLAHPKSQLRLALKRQNQTVDQLFTALATEQASVATNIGAVVKKKHVACFNMICMDIMAYTLI